MTDPRQLARNTIDRVRYKPLTWKEVIEIAGRQQDGTATEEDHIRGMRWLKAVCKVQGIDYDNLVQQMRDRPSVKDDWRDDDPY